MKLKNVAMKNGKKVNLNIKGITSLITPNKEFEVSDKIGKELLNKKIDGKPIVEKVTEIKPKTETKKEE